ncbi:GNAT family N-acetyltransferase [Micromonospora ureilytica]|uniref:GNAT family N-acetyltransferase n=1 Tax=Micromonospora ureilytica TaxID=709868 RepID=UPI0033E4E2CD
MTEAIAQAPDNFVWAALTGPQQTFGEFRGRAARYRPDFGLFAAVADWDDDLAWADLAALAGPGAFLGVAGREARTPRGWNVALRDETLQLAARRVDAYTHPEIVELGPADKAEMLSLVDRAQPGPFADRTNELGTYLGIRRGGALVAMAGERFRAAGWTEISAVCTDPAYRRRGLAGALVRTLTARIHGRGDDAFLHVRESNHGAIRLYQALGFVVESVPLFIGVTVPG